MVYWNETLVAMHSVLPIAVGNMKFAYRGHRLVVLPDFQGLGIGTKLNDFVGQYYINQGLKFFVRATHIRVKGNMGKNSLWRPTGTNDKLRIDSESVKKTKFKYDTKRIAGSFEYMGEDYVKKEHKTIIVDNNDFITEKELKELKEKYYLIIATGTPKKENECEILCKKLGIRTEMLYFNYRDKVLKNRKFKTKNDNKIIVVEEKKETQQLSLF